MLELAAQLRQRHLATVFFEVFQAPRILTSVRVVVLLHAVVREVDELVVDAVSATRTLPGPG